VDTTDKGTTVKDNVNHPPHYLAHPSGIECIEVTEHMSFCVGNAVKYLWRADHKGNDIEDLRKAAWYINREIERREKEGLVTIPKQPEQPKQLELFDLPIRSTEPFGW
jgi:hypothetical protein